MSRRARARSLAMQLKRADAYTEPESRFDDDDADDEAWLDLDDQHQDTARREATQPGAL